jgi:cysteine synthase B
VQPDSAFHGLEGLKHMPSAINRASLRQPALDGQSPHRRLRDGAGLAPGGLFVGVSSGAAVVALQVAQELEQGVVVAVFPDAATNI